VPKWCPKDYPVFGSSFDPVICVSSPIWVVATKVGKLGISSWFAGFYFDKDLIEWRIGLREGKAQVKAKSTLRSGSHVRTNLDENTKFGTLSLLLLLLLSSFTVYCFHPDFWFRPQFWQNWRSLPSVWGSITLLMTQRKFLIPKFYSILKPTTGGYK